MIFTPHILIINRWMIRQNSDWTWKSVLLGLAICAGIALIFYLLALLSYKKQKTGDKEKIKSFKKYMKARNKGTGRNRRR